MNTELKYVGITHEQATVAQRSFFALNDQEQHLLSTLLMKNFSLRGLMLFFTCNRAEIYFESDVVSALMVKGIFMAFIQTIRNTKILPTDVVTVYETSDETVQHLFLVANGFQSAIPGDQQVIGQLRSAYRKSLQSGHQGSMFERCIQHVFRSHKQVFNSTCYHHQNISVSTKIRNVLEHHYPLEEKKLNLLIVGAGTLSREILPALNRIKQFNLHLSNRTFIRAEKLARKYQATVVDWNIVKANKLEAFDVIITAVSHYKNLITHIEAGLTKKVLIDLAMPTNISHTVHKDNIRLYNIDLLYKHEDTNRPTSNRDIDIVHQIILYEYKSFFDWLHRKRQRLQEAA